MRHPAAGRPQDGGEAAQPDLHPGDHDENIDFATAVNLVGRERAEQVRDATLALYAFARDYAAQRGIILADTKFEFGTDADGTLYGWLDPRIRHG